MDKSDVASALAQAAVLLELKGENQFKVRAFHAAADRVLDYAGSLETFAAELEAGKLKGFGTQLAGHALEVCRTGKLSLLDELVAAFPQGVLEMLEVPGLGVKKVKSLYDGLSVSSIDELRNACLSGEVAKLKGFGEKSQQKILQALELKQTYRGKLRLDAAGRLAAEVMQALLAESVCQRIETAGSLRRKNPVVNNINFVAAAADEERFISALRQIPGAMQAVKNSAQCIVLRLENGTPLYFHLTGAGEFAAALFLQTGSASHIAALKSLEPEAAVFAARSGAEGADLDSEQEIYNALGMALIPPEAREGRGEIEIAQEARRAGGVFPELVHESDICGIIHAHTTYSDGLNTLEELARAVHARGYQYLGVSDHSRSAFYAGGLSENAVLRQHEEIDRLNEELAPFVIFKGIESEIHPDGSLDYRDAVLEKFDFVIVSVHAASRPNCAEMTERVCRALALPYSTILGHPSGRLLLQREPFDLDMEQILACAAEHGAAVELNANPRRLDLDWSYHQTAKRLGIPVPVCPDAHAIDGIADIRYGIASARKGLLTAEDVLTCWPVVRVRDFFHRRKRGLASARHKL